MMSMFVFERERDSAHVLAAGIPDAWVKDKAGVKVQGLQTPYGLVHFNISTSGNALRVSVSGTFDAGGHKLVLRSPLSKAPKTMRVDGRKFTLPISGEVVLRRLPTNVVFSY
jgi:hypothetical protein